MCIGEYSGVTRTLHLLPGPLVWGQGVMGRHHSTTATTGTMAPEHQGTMAHGAGHQHHGTSTSTWASRVTVCLGEELGVVVSGLSGWRAPRCR